MAPLKRLKSELQTWSPIWVDMWIVIVLMLIVLAFVLPFWWWWTAVAIAFGIPEIIGAWARNDRYPPLTEVIVKYLDREISYPLMFGSAGAILGYWYGVDHPARVGAFAAILGWLVAHFDKRYERKDSP